MNSTITKETLINVFENKGFASEITELLNSVIDSEFEKDDNEIDFDLIDECTAALLSLNLDAESAASVAFPLVSSHKFLSKIGATGWRSLSKSARVILIAAAVLAATITTSAAVGNITKNNLFDNLIPITSASTTIAKTSTREKSTSQSVSQTQKSTSPLVDESIVVSKAQHPSKGYFACYETAGKDERNPNCHYERIALNADNEIDYPSSYKVKVSNKNTEFNEDDYIKLNCENSVCNEETGELHEFSEWRITKKPTCTELGEQQRVCKVCSTKQTCPVKATGEHEYKLFREKRAYMDENYSQNYKTYDGKITYKCIYCLQEQYKTVAKAKYLVIDQYEFEYDGKAHRPRVYAVLDKNKKVISEYAYGINFNDSGDAVDIYNDYGVCARVAGRNYDQYIEVKFRIIPDTVKFTGVLTGNGTIVPEWEKARFTENVEKSVYEIQYSKNKSFSGAKTVKAYGNAQKKVIDDVKKGETYYIRIRGVANRSQNLTIPEGHWSEVRKITVK